MSESRVGVPAEAEDLLEALAEALADALTSVDTTPGERGLLAVVPARVEPPLTSLVSLLAPK